MTRRLVATLTFAAMSAGVLAVAAPAHAHPDNNNVICIAGDNQRRPGYVHAICIQDVEIGH
jgi:hypothetical protein